MPFNSDPYIYRDPSLILKANALSVPPVAADLEFMCVTKETHFTPITDTADGDSYCAPGFEIQVPICFELNIPVMLTYTNGGNVGTWNVVHPLAGTTQTFELKASAALATGPSSPKATFQIVIPPIPLLDGERGQSSRFDLNARTKGMPVFTYT